MIRLETRFRAPIFRGDVSDYVRELEITVFAFSENGEDIVVGRIAATQVMTAEAELDGENLFDVFDADSQGLSEVCEALFDGQEPRPELTYEATGRLVFIYRIVLHPSIRQFAQGIISSVGVLFGEDTILVLWRGNTDLTDRELDEIGFAKIAGTELVFSHQSLLTHYSKKHPQGDPASFDYVAEPEFEDWVDNQDGEA